MVLTPNNQDTENNVLKKALLCPKCKTALRHRIKRGFVVKNILNWLPVKRFYCYKCKRKLYIWN